MFVLLFFCTIELNEKSIHRNYQLKLKIGIFIGTLPTNSM